MSRLLVVLLALAVGACSSAEAVKAPPEVKLRQDLYCDLAAKIRWSKADTPETVRQVIRENSKIDRLCRTPGGVS